MRNEQLKYILEHINLEECQEVVQDYIYYSRRPVKQRCQHGNGRYTYITNEFEFLVIAEGGIKQAIILRCGEVDLHWYVLRKWRSSHVLSDALRTGIIHDIWPENKTISCCYNYYDNYDEKYAKTKHLAEIAGLILE